MIHPDIPVIAIRLIPSDCYHTPNLALTNGRGTNDMPHDRRLVTDESKIEVLQDTIPEWIKRLERPKRPMRHAEF